MPSQQRARSAEEQIETTISEEIERISDAIAAQLGPAPGARHVSDAEAAKAWWRRDPMVDYDALVQTLETTGITNPAILDPNNKTDGLAIVRLVDDAYLEEIIATLSQPLPPEKAVAWAVLCEFPMRHDLLAAYADDPEGMVALAEKLGKAAPEAKPMPQMPDDMMSAMGG